MLKISTVLDNIIATDLVAKKAIERGIMNYSSYARSLKDMIEEKTKKEVDEKTIMVALSRLSKRFRKSDKMEHFSIHALSVNSGLEEWSYEKTEELLKAIAKLNNSLELSYKSYVTISQGINEVTIIAQSDIAKKFSKALEAFNLIYSNKRLAGITVKFDLDYLQTPNFFAHLTSTLSLKDINIVEIVSTASELTLIVDKDDIEECVKLLSVYL
ncbi:hypothetical protein ACFL3T_00465 [Patescibacteria group bacterium]